jgi:hypothetical protein
MRAETYARLVAEAERLGGYTGPSALAQQWLEEALERDAPELRLVKSPAEAKVPPGGYVEF